MRVYRGGPAIRAWRGIGHSVQLFSYRCAQGRRQTTSPPPPSKIAAGSSQWTRDVWFVPSQLTGPLALQEVSALDQAEPMGDIHGMTAKLSQPDSSLINRGLRYIENPIRVHTRVGMLRLLWVTCVPTLRPESRGRSRLVPPTRQPTTNGFCVTDHTWGPERINWKSEIIAMQEAGGLAQMSLASVVPRAQGYIGSELRASFARRSATKGVSGP